MKYHGNNPVGLALADDPRGELRDRLLQQLGDYQAAAAQAQRSASRPDLYQRQLAAAQCAAACASVVKEFHAICVRAEAGQPG